MRLLFGILLIGILAGCAVHTGSVMVDDKTVVNFKMNTMGSMSWEKDGVKASYNTKKVERNFWQKNFLPMISGAVDTASRGR